MKVTMNTRLIVIQQLSIFQTMCLFFPQKTDLEMLLILDSSRKSDCTFQTHSAKRNIQMRVKKPPKNMIIVQQLDMLKSLLFVRKLAVIAIPSSKACAGKGWPVM